MEVLEVQASVEQQKAEILEKLLDIITTPETSPEQRQAAKQSLRRIGNRAIIEPLGRLIEESSDESVVSNASELLGYLPVTDAIRTSLVKLVWHDSPDVRRAAMRALARIGDRKTAAILSLIVADSRDSTSIFDLVDGDLAQRARDSIQRMPGASQSPDGPTQ